MRDVLEAGDAAEKGVVDFGAEGCYGAELFSGVGEDGGVRWV